MIKLEEIGIENAVAFHVAGKITESDMDMAFAEMKEKIRLHTNIVLYEQIDSFGGVELAGIIDKFKYLFDMGISNITKVAIVTDKAWIEKIVTLEDKIFRRIEMKVFSIDDKALAIEFLREQS